MTESDVSRRRFVQRSVGAAAAAVLPTTPSAAEGAPPRAPLVIVCVGAHPDDPESGCGGTLARYTAAGHAVRIVYLTRGERGIDGKSLEEAARIRTLEAEAACVALGATPLFVGQIDGDTAVTKQHVAVMTGLLAEQKPDVVFAHWPIDTHPDHQVASVLATRAFMALRTGILFYYEVNPGSQTSAFQPTTWVDIGSVLEKKRAALLAHASQDGAAIWRMHHEPAAQWRGREAGVVAAEAFVQLRRGDRAGTMPGLEKP
jgi:LmbE family N-acetylglucosaminyl deacetylase